MHRLSRAGALLSVIATTLAAPLAAQRVTPGTYAITNARIVPVAGPAIEKGTLVVRDGLIAAVGATVTPPADARVVDGSGLTIYPG
ncbi:MAG: amidohydrolase, partial [Actinobacteria bacterium]|nr:amidohydrolase [Actinomycetota bacterium]